MYVYNNWLWILCGTDTNGAHYLYAYTLAGVQKCFITIPQAVGMSRVDGFYISGSTAYIADSQGPIYASTAGKLGGSVYAVQWTNPCGCTSDGTSCTSSTATWSPTIIKTYVISATDSAIQDGSGVDNYFRNSGIVVLGDSFFSVNGVHPVTQNVYDAYYPKSVIKQSLSTSAVTQKWSFLKSTLGRDVDMEGLTCGADKCTNYLYIGDEYMYIYKLNLQSTGVVVDVEWNILSAAGVQPTDKGIEALAYADSTGYFYAGIQQTAMVHVLQLQEPTASSLSSTSSTALAVASPTASSTLAALTSSIPLTALASSTSQSAQTTRGSSSTSKAASVSSSWHMNVRATVAQLVAVTIMACAIS